MWVVFLCFMVFNSVEAYSQFSIRQVRTPVFPVDIRSIDVSGEVIFATGNTSGKQSVFAKSTDGGKTWVKPEQQFAADDNLNTVSFPNTQTGYIAGNKGAVYKTTDGGETWARAADTTHFRGNISQLHFFTADSGYLCGSVYNGSVICRTTDGGSFWQTLQTPVNNTPNAMHWDDYNNGILVGANSKILRTTNAGVNWTTFTPGSKELFAVSRISTTTILIAGNGVLYKSTNNGESFSPQTPPENMVYYAICFRDSMNGCLAGQGGKIYKTSDGGISWSQPLSCTAEDIRSIVYFGGSYIIGCQGGAVLKVSEDFIVWSTIAPDSRTYYGLTVQNGNITIAGEKGNIQIGESNGMLWLDPAHAATNATLYSVERKDSMIFATGNGGVFCVSSNNGNSWVVKQVIISGAVGRGISFIDMNRGFIAGFDGSIYYTSDRGETWILKNSIAMAELTGLSMRSDSFGVAIGSGKRIFRTTDMGVNWQPFLGASPKELLFGLHVVNRNVAYVSGENGCVYKTTDGFNSITLISDTAGLYGKTIFAVAAINDSLVFAGGRNGYVLAIGGNNRLQLYDSTGSDILSMAKLDDYGVVATGAGGMVFRIGLQVIPVSELRCTAVAYGSQVQVRWQATAAVNAGWFYVQYSGSNHIWKTDTCIRVEDRNSLGAVDYTHVLTKGTEAVVYCRICAVDYNGAVSYSNEVRVIWLHGEDFELLGNYPNPCNPATTIAYRLGKTAEVALLLYDITGRKILGVDRGLQNPGLHTLKIDLSHLPSGVYFYDVSAGNATRRGRLLLLR